MVLSQEHLTLIIINYLEQHGCVTTLLKQDTEFHVHYTLKLDVKPQPAIRVTDKPSVIIPKGSQESVLNALFRILNP